VQINGSSKLNKLSPRIVFLFIAISCAGLMGYALYSQYVGYLDPCPLCVFQRVAFIWMGVFALLAVLHNPAGWGRKLYALLVTLGGVFGAAVAGRHIWLQSLPPGDVPECGPGLNYMLDNFPLSEVLSTVLNGSGSCAEVSWTFMGLSMPMWTLVWYIGLMVLALWAGYKAIKH
jgi:disulfide bond formation protein DsbB